MFFVFFFQAEDGIRDLTVTGVQTCALPILFRYERQQRGRLREHFQLNMDITGEPGPAADAEIIAAAIDIARAFGLGPKDVRLRVSDRRIVTAQLANRYHVSDGEMPGVLAGLDKWDRNPADAEAILRKVLPATDQRIGAILEFMSGLGEGATELRKSEQAEPLNECVARLEERSEERRVGKECRSRWSPYH